MADHCRSPQGPDPDDLRFSAYLLPGVQPATVAVSGELDAYTVAQLRVVLERLRRAGHHHLVLDLSGLEFLSATGVAVIAEHLAWATDVGGSLILIDPSPPIRRVLTLTDHHHLIDDAIPRPRRATSQQP